MPELESTLRVESYSKSPYPQLRVDSYSSEDGLSIDYHIYNPMYYICNRELELEIGQRPCIYDSLTRPPGRDLPSIYLEGRRRERGSWIGVDAVDMRCLESPQLISIWRPDLYSLLGEGVLGIAIAA